MKSLLRWAGGKSWLLKHLDELLPSKVSNYIEPFLGSATVYLHIKEKYKDIPYYLSDCNEELINFYNVIKDNADLLYNEIKYYKNDKEFYYLIRSKQCLTDVEKASRFYYLNKFSYNGLYRTNLQGTYNVPYGSRNLKTTFDYNEIIKHQEAFINASLFSYDFQESLKYCKKNSLFFLDPPYTVAHDTNGFLQYNQNIFKWEDQVRLKNMILEIKKKKAYFILTNAHHHSIMDLFKDCGKFIEVERHSCIGGVNAIRGRKKEYLFTNYI